MVGRDQRHHAVQADQYVYERVSVVQRRLDQQLRRNRKEHFAAIDPVSVLKKVVALPVTQWNYKAEPGVLRIGPMAQDFYAAFGVGQDNLTIAQTDEAGVAFAAIQGSSQVMRKRTR